MSNGKNATPEGIYHEKQSRMLCAVHALNNLFQQPKTFTKADLDNICSTLAPDKSYFNPHRNMVGLGNYDVNVIIAAIESKDLQVTWFDKRKLIEDLNLDQIKGFILNIPTDFSLGFIHLPIKRKHWTTIRQIDGIYYMFDSKNNQPDEIGKAGEVTVYLKLQVADKDKELLIVFSKDIERDSLWVASQTADKTQVLTDDSNKT